MSEPFLDLVRAALAAGRTDVPSVTHFVADAIEADDPPGALPVDRGAFQGAIYVAMQQIARKDA